MYEHTIRVTKPAGVAWLAQADETAQTAWKSWWSSQPGYISTSNVPDGEDSRIITHLWASQQDCDAAVTARENQPTYQVKRDYESRNGFLYQLIYRGPKV